MDRVRIIPAAGLAIIFFLFYLSIRKNRNKPKCHAAERLFEAFKEEIQDLSLGTGDAYEILRQAFPRHEKAYTQFRPYLNGKILRNFDEAWKEYSCGGEENSNPFLEQYFTGGNQTLARERRQLALRNILRFLLR